MKSIKVSSGNHTHYLKGGGDTKKEKKEKVDSNAKININRRHKNIFREAGVSGLLMATTSFIINFPGAMGINSPLLWHLELGVPPVLKD